MRTSSINRKTNETDINLTLNLDGSGKTEVHTGCGFLDHMLTLMARHARFNINITCKGDIDVDFHHTVEDIGIVFGQAFNEALADKKGIARYGSCILPMDETLIMTAVDISGRSYLKCSFEGLTEKVGGFDTELVEEFFYAFTRQAELTLHIKQLDGSNTHHILEGAFKSVAKSLRQAVAIDQNFKDEIPSTKGVL